MENKMVVEEDRQTDRLQYPFQQYPHSCGILCVYGSACLLFCLYTWKAFCYIHIFLVPFLLLLPHRALSGGAVE